MLPLEGLKVLDFTHVLAGPACSYYLGLLGAEVIKVESQNGDAMRHRGGSDRAAQDRGMSTAYLTQGAGKQSVAIDLASRFGARTMRRLLEQADVFIENHLPKTMLTLGLDPDSVRTINPQLIHCSMSGYGRGGPLENAPAYDVNIQAISGLMSVTGTTQSGPIRVGAPIVDYGVALSAGFAITTALHQRNSTGTGCFIDVSMLETAHLMMSSTITDYLFTGREPARRGNAANSRSPAAGNFPCRDGIISLGVNEENQFRNLARVLGRECWLSDERFASRSARRNAAAAFEEELCEVLQTRTAGEWETALQAGGVPAAKLRSLPESLDMQHVKDRRFIHECSDGSSVPTLPFRFDGNEAFSPTSPPPVLGQDTKPVLRSLKDRS